MSINPAQLFESERLLFRPMTEKNLDDLHFRCYADPDVTRFLHRKTSEKPEETAIILHDIIAFYETHGFGFMSVIEKSAKTFIGVAGLNIIDETGEYEVGYVLCKECWGKGFASESAKFFIDFAFNNLDIDYLLALTNHDHKASQRVLLKQGMTFFDKRKAKGMDCSCFKITKEKWTANAVEGELNEPTF